MAFRLWSTLFSKFLSKLAKPLQGGHLSKANNIFETISVHFKEVPLHFRINSASHQQICYQCSTVSCGRQTLEIGKILVDLLSVSVMFSKILGEKSPGFQNREIFEKSNCFFHLFKRFQSAETAHSSQYHITLKINSRK